MGNVTETGKTVEKIFLFMAVGGKDQFFSGREPSVNHPLFRIGLCAISFRHCPGVDLQQAGRCYQLFQRIFCRPPITGMPGVKETVPLIIFGDQIKMRNDITARSPSSAK